MDSGLYAVISGGAAAMVRMDVIANNVANSNTTGFRGDQPVFRLRSVEQVFPQGVLRAAAGLQRPGLEPLVVELAGVDTSFAQGPLRETGHPLDVAIQGPGFFVVQTPDGLAFTRRGNFNLSPRGELITDTGAFVLGKAGPITLEGQEVVIDAEGNVSVEGQLLDTLRIVDFPDPARLVKTDSTMFRAVQPWDEGVEVEVPVVRQRFLEGSNVNVVQELVGMIEASRAYEAYQRVITSFLGERGIFSRAVNDLGRV